jgi:hypothetical protein
MRSYKIEKLIKEVVGEDYTVEVKRWIKDGYGAIVTPSKKLLRIRKDNTDYLPLIWHEMGHIATDKPNDSVYQREIKAQTWALKNLLHYKHIDLFEESIVWMKTWLEYDGSGTPADLIYRKVAQKLLKDLKKGFKSDKKR